jgi:hypothetical protein
MKTMKAEMPPFSPRPIYSDLYPLDEFYAARNQTLNVIDRIEPNKVPEPYRSLLVHKTDMTSTLEKFYGETLHVEVLQKYIRENQYYRESALILDVTKNRVEFGAIKIILSLFPFEAQQEILREQLPLGRILTLFEIPFTSRPVAWMRVLSDTHINATLQLDGRQLLHGRRNTLLDSWERPLAEIVEILPP